MLTRASKHRGTSFIEVYQNCNVFNDGAWKYTTDRDVKEDNVVELEQGKPLIFGKNKDKGVRLHGMMPEVVQLDGSIATDDLLFHDEKVHDSNYAFMLSRMRYPELPEPIGVFRDIERTTYDDEINQQVEDAIADHGEGDLDVLFNSGDTWNVT